MEDKLPTLKRLQAQYLQAKVNHEVARNKKTSRRLQEVEDALIQFGISIILDRPPRVSDDGRRRILELVASF